MSSSDSSSDEREHLSVRSSDTGSGSSSSSIRTTQSVSESHSTSSRSSVSLHSIDSVSDQRSISSSRLQRTDSENSGSESSGSSTSSVQSISSKSEESSQESSRQSQVSEQEIGSFGVEELEQIRGKKEQCSPSGEIDINNELMALDVDTPRNRTGCSSMVSNKRILRGGRTFRKSKKSPYSERGNGSRSPIEFIISKSLASHLGDVLVKTSGLAGALGRVVAMPIQGTVGGVKSFGKFLKDKDCEVNGDLKRFYKIEWTPVITAVIETFDKIESDRVETRNYLEELNDVLTKCFETIDEDHELVVKAVESVEKRILKIEKKQKKVVSFDENGSHLQADLVRMSSSITGIQDNILEQVDDKLAKAMNIIDSKLRKYNKDLKKNADLQDYINELKERLNEHEEEIGKLSENISNARKNSEEFKNKFKKQFLQPVGTGLGNILRENSFGTSADMEKIQPTEVGQEQRDNIIHNAPMSTHVERVELSGQVVLKTSTDISYPSKSMPQLVKFEWKNTHVAGVVMQKLDFPEVMIKNNEYLKREFSQFQYFSCDAIKIVIATTSVLTQGGHLGVTWDPFTVSSSCGVVNSIPLSNLYTFEIPAGDSYVRELTVPFICLQNLLSLVGKRAGSYCMGSLLFHPLNSLKAPADTTQSVKITVFAQLINPVYKLQTLIHDMYPSTSTSASKGVSGMDKNEEKVKETISELLVSPNLPPIVVPQVLAEPPIVGVPEVIMPITPIIKENRFTPTLPPIKEKPVQEIVSQLSERDIVSETPAEQSKVVLDPTKFDKNGNEYSEQNPYKIHKEYLSRFTRTPEAENFQRLYQSGKIRYDSKTGHYKQIFPNMDGEFGGLINPLQVSDFIQENIIHMGSWKSTDVGKLLSLNCSPTELVRKDAENFYMPSLAQIAALFKHWRGSLIYKFTFGANTLSRGKLRFVALPEQKIFADPESATMIYLPSDIYDLNSTQRSMEVVVPFNHTMNYQYTNIEYFSDANYHGELILCRLHMYVVDPLMTNVGSNDTIDYYVTVRPGEDFEFCTPIGIRMGHPIITNPQDDTVVDGEEGIENKPVMIARDAATRGYITTLETMNFNVERGYVLNGQLFSKESITINVGPNVQDSKIGDNPTSWLASTHVRWQGSLDYEFVVSNHNVNIAKTILVSYLPYGYEPSKDIEKTPGYLPSSGFKTIIWDLSKKSKHTIKIRWSTPLQSLLVANKGLGEGLPDNKMYNGRIVLSLLGPEKSKVDILGYVRAGEDFKLFDRSYLKTIGKATDGILPMSNYKLLRSINQTPVDKSDAMSSMPWPVENVFNTDKKLKPTTEELKEMNKSELAALQSNFLKEVAAERKKANAVADMEVHPDMMGWVGPMLIGKENSDAIKDLNLPATIGGINKIVDNKGMCKLASLAENVSGSDIEKLTNFIRALTPVLDETSKNLPDILKNSSKGVENASEGFSIISTIGKKIMAWATTLIDNSMPGWIKSLHEHGEFVFALLATIVSIVMFVWWYRKTSGQSFVTRTLSLLCILWAPLLGKGLFEFAMWLFTTFKTVLESTVEQLSEKFGWFRSEEKEEVASKESIALQYVVSDMEVEGWIGKLFQSPSIIFTPILMIGASLIALKVLGRPTKSNENANFMQRCGTLVKQFTGVASLAGFVMNLKKFGDAWGETTMQWIHWMMGTTIPEDAAVALGVEFKVKQWMDEVSDCSREENIHQLVAEPDGVEKIKLLYERGKIINKALLERKNLPYTYSVLLRPIIESTKKMVDLAHKSKGSGEMRRDPFMIVMFGPPGQGKSATTELLVSDLLDMHGYAKEHRRYTRNPGDNHWNGYDRQPVVVYDDLGAVISRGEASDISEIIAIKSNCPQSVKMADLEEKGKMFGSDFIIASTNWTVLDANTDIRTHGAFYRRRDILVKVTRESPKDPNDLAKGLVYQLHRMAYTTQIEIVDGKEEKYDKPETVPVGDPMNYEMFLKFCYLKSKEHLEAQTALVAYMKNLSLSRKEPMDVYELAQEFDKFFNKEDIPKADNMFVNPIAGAPMCDVSCNGETFIYDLSILVEEYNSRGFSGDDLHVLLMENVDYYEEALEGVKSHNLDDHLRCICCCDTTKQFRNEECEANEMCVRVLRENIFLKNKQECKFINNKYQGSVSLVDMSHMHLFHVIVYMRWLSVATSPSVCVIGDFLKTRIKPKIMESCIEYRAEHIEFPLGSSLIKTKKFKILYWEGIGDMYPTLMLQCGGVWIIDHEEIYLITDHLKEEYPENLYDLVFKCTSHLVKHGCLLGMREILRHVPENDIVVFRDASKAIGSINEKMKISHSQVELLTEIKNMYDVSPLWVLFMLCLYERAHENCLINERELKFKRNREAILIATEKFRIQEESWFDKCSQGTKIAIGCGVGIVALGAALGTCALIYKSICVFFPGTQAETKDNFIHEQEVIDLVPQAGAANSSGDFKTKYNRMRKRVVVKHKKQVAIRNSEYTAEELHMETAQKINAIAQHCGADMKVLESTGLVDLEAQTVKEIFADLDKDLLYKIMEKYPTSQNIVRNEKKLYEKVGSPNCVYICGKGKVIVPREVTNLIEILGFDESNKAIRGEQPSHFKPDLVRADLKELIETGYKGPMEYKKIIHKNLRDIRTEQLVRVVLRDANAQIFFPKSKKRAQVIRVFGHVIIFPIHYVDDFEEGEVFHMAMMNSVHQLTFEAVRLICFSPGQDLVAYDCGSKVPAARDIRKHFITIEDVMNYKPCEGFLANTCCGVKGVTQYVDYTPQMNLITHENYPSGVFYDAGSFGNHNLTWAIQYPIHSANGFCGSFISRISPQCERKIMGIHVAANGNFNYGYAELITQESLDDLYAYFERKKEKPITTCPDFEVMRLPIVANVEDNYDIETERNSGVMKYNIDLKRVTFVGELEDRLVPTEINTTQIEPSIFHGLLGPVQTEPSILHEFDSRLCGNEFHSDLQKVWHPGVDGISKYGDEVKIFKHSEIKLVEDYLCSVFENVDNSLNRRQVLTEDEMINGIDGASYWDSIDMSTAPGYPYALYRDRGIKGKKYLFDEIEKDGKTSYVISDALLRERLDSRECCAREGKTFPTLALEKVKDERRKKKKIYQKPATRTFSCLPVDLNLLYRKYFLDFAVMQMDNRDQFACQVGINPDSLEWTRLYHQLNAQGGLAFAGDYGKFDGIGMPDLYMSITNVINKWYNDGNDGIRRVLVHELFHRYSLCGKNLFRIDQGMPSGFSMTVIFNSLMNFYFLAIAWLNLTKRMDFDVEGKKASPMEAFEYFTEIATYGDDNIVAIRDEIKDIYNLKTVSGFLKEHGITYTDDQKRPIEQSEPYVRLKDVTFLKRGFSPMDKGKFIQRAPLDKTSITEQIQWVRKSPDPKAALLANCDNALYEASIYGKEYYDALKSKLCILVSKKKWVHAFESYENQLTRWWTNITTCDDYSHIHQLIHDGKIVSGQPLCALLSLSNIEDFREECGNIGIPPVAFELDFGFEDFN